MITKLEIFDFDDTIARVPVRPQPHEKKHGWSGKDWWGSKASLTMPFYNWSDINQEVVDAFRAAKADPTVHAILLTGRRGVVAQHVRDVLNFHGLYGKRVIPPTNPDALDKHKGNEHDLENRHDGHEEYYSGDHRYEPNYPRQGKRNKPSGSTADHKVFVIERLVNNLSPDLEEVRMWEDRKDHIPLFQSLGHKILKRFANVRKFTINQVFNYPGGHYIRAIPVHDPKLH